MFKTFNLLHPAILEDRRRKFRPEPEINATVLANNLPPEPPPEPPKKIKQTIRKKNKDIKVEIIEPRKDDDIVLSTKRTKTLKQKSPDIKAEQKQTDDDALINNIDKKISTLNIISKQNEPPDTA